MRTPCAQREFARLVWKVMDPAARSLISMPVHRRPALLCAGSGNKMYMGTAAISNGDYIHHAIDHSDLIILVGHDVRLYAAFRPMRHTEHSFYLCTSSHLTVQLVRHLNLTAVLGRVRQKVLMCQ